MDGYAPIKHTYSVNIKINIMHVPNKNKMVIKEHTGFGKEQMERPGQKSISWMLDPFGHFSSFRKVIVGPHIKTSPAAKACVLLTTHCRLDIAILTENVF